MEKSPEWKSGFSGKKSELQGGATGGRRSKNSGHAATAHRPQEKWKNEKIGLPHHMINNCVRNVSTGRETQGVFRDGSYRHLQFRGTAAHIVACGHLNVEALSQRGCRTLWDTSHFGGRWPNPPRAAQRCATTGAERVRALLRDGGGESACSVHRATSMHRLATGPLQQAPVKPTPLR